MSKATSQADETPTKSTARPVWMNGVLFGLAVLAGLLTYALTADVMTEAQRRMAGIFVMAMVLWISEGIPLFATSLLVIATQVWFIAVPDTLEVDIPFTEVLGALSNPIIYLFLGGFVLAKGIQKEGLDTQMASVLLRPFGNTPYGILAGVMLITAFFSMWMSNSATTAMMIVLVIPLAAQIPETDTFRRGLILGVPFAANIGGIGTPIGTPPNAIAMAQLGERDLTITFTSWMVVAVPLLVVTLVAMWIALLLVFRPKTKRFELKIREGAKLNLNAWIIYATFAVTVALWLTSELHGVPTAVVAMIPAAVFTASRIIGREDFNRLEWDVLVLMAGGIALGGGLTGTELDQWLINTFPFEELSFFWLLGVCTILTVCLSTVISNTVTANIVLPIALALAATFPGAEPILVMGVMVAVSSSYAMGLPISTPPNVIAYGSGMVDSRNIMLVGGLTSVVASILIISTGPRVIPFLLELL